MIESARTVPALDVALCAAAIMKDRQLADRAAAAVGTMQLWYPQKWNRWPCFSCRSTGHCHARHADGRLQWAMCVECEGQGWFWRQRPGGATFTDSEIVALYQRELERRQSL